MKKFLILLVLPILLLGCIKTEKDTEIKDTIDVEQPSDEIVTDVENDGLVEGSKVNYGIKYDPNKWTVEASGPSEESEYTFTHVDGDVFAMIIPERIPMEMESLTNIAVENAKNLDPDIEVVYKENVTVNSEDMIEMKMDGYAEGIDFEYYGYYYSGDIGSIQFVTFTSENLISLYEDDIKELLNGLEIYEMDLSDSTEEPQERSEVTIEGENVDYKITYDENIWYVEKSDPAEESEYFFEHTDGDVYAMVIPERIAIDADALKEMALENARVIAPDIEVTFEEDRNVNGTDLKVMKMSGSAEGIQFEYYGYYYTGDAGTIQFVTFTGATLSSVYENDMTELLNGLEIL